jgi:cytoskeletal protein CcmA (bactofilin family)
VATPNPPKQPEKISADCPHCGFSQLESAYAKSTFCRKCGQHYSIEKALAKEATSLKTPSLLDKLSKLVSGEKIRDICCFSCGNRQRVSSSAQSSICPQCGSYIDLRDFKISGQFGRSIQTQGEVFVTSKGEVTSAKIACGSAHIEGKMRGNLSCTGTVSFKMQGKQLGSVETYQLVVEKRSDVEFVRPIKVHSAEIHGKISARIMCETGLTITKGGTLEGVVYAKAINIERGGIFSGELFIGQRELTQPDLVGAGEDHPGLFGDETLGLGPA